MPIESVLIATDFSDLARSTYAGAAELARAHGWKLWLAHVAEALPPFCYLHAEGISTIIPEDAHNDELDDLLQKEAAESPAFEGIEVETRLLHHQSPHEAIVELVARRGVGLVVIGTHGRRGLTHFLLGSTADKIVRFSPVPVLTWREGNGGLRPQAPRHALVPIDFSGNSNAVIPALRFLAEHHRTRFTFLYALDATGLDADRYPGQSVRDALVHVARSAPELARERFEKEREKRLEGLEVELEVCDGPPDEEITRRAGELEVDLVVVATHGWTGLRHFILGSVAEKVVRKAPCSVLTIRPKPPEKGGSGDVQAE